MLPTCCAAAGTKFPSRSLRRPATKSRKLEGGEFEAIILAAAGLKRLGREEMVRERLPLDEMCPAAGQGALAIEVRAGDAATAQAVLFMDDPASRATTSCERALLNGL